MTDEETDGCGKAEKSSRRKKKKRKRGKFEMEP